MVVFNGTFDLIKFQECLQYVRDSLNWLVAAEEKTPLSQTTIFPAEVLDQTAATLRALLLRRAYHLHNTRTRINRLPSEVFRHILSYLGDYPLPFPSPFSNFSNLKQVRGFTTSDPPMGLWNRASCVCRQWRQEVLSMQGLWAMVKVGGAATREWADVWLSRSGALPISLCVHTRSSDELRTLVEDVPWLLDRGRHINVLRFHRSIRPHSLETILQHLAGQLEILMVSLPPHRVTFGRSTHELPRLQFLSVAQMTVWRDWSMRELRHLSLMSQRLAVKDVRGLLVILAATPRLEELMLYELYVARDHWDGLFSLIKEDRSPVHMPRLEKLFIHQIDKAAIGTLSLVFSGKLTVTSTCTQYYIMMDSGFKNTIANDDRVRPIPAKRLALATECLVGTDGVSTWVITRNSALDFIGSIDNTQVQELWLQNSSRAADQVVHDASSSSPETTCIEEMDNVVKLVLVRNVSHWLTESVSYLPALKELHILVQFKNDRQPILEFLAQRKQAGKEVGTLHFVGDHTSDDSEAFNDWREDSSEFRRYTTNEVIFEEVHLFSKSAYEEHVSARLGLPEACKHPSQVNMLWRPWNSFATLDKVV